MNYYYVKLSCPSEDDDGHFESIVQACIDSQIKTFEIDNIPNSIYALKKDDLVIFILSGDSSKKSRYFKNYKINEFTNGIYAIAKTISITPSEKKFVAEFFPFKECITREDLYLYPQFSDNLGVLTKGSPNQAGLYEITQDVFLSLLDYATKNNLINTSYDILRDKVSDGCLVNNAKDNPVFLKAQSRKTFSDLQSLIGQNTPSERKNRSHISDLILSNFCVWFHKSENFKSSYAGLVNYSVLKSWDEIFFSSNLFSIDAVNIESSIKHIKTLIENKQNDEKWNSFNDSTSKGAPKAVLGKENYYKFLDNILNTPDILDEIRRLSTPIYSDDYKKTNIGKTFLLLAGISGTGKTRFIREQAEQSGSLSETYQLVPVRPDWHEPSDLLGYVSRLNGKPEYVATDVLKFVVKAWQAILKAGFDFDGEKITGNKNSLESVAPYWLCLDEMNLAPVEQYFADYLSVIETRKWVHSDNAVEYTCDALLNAKLINEVADSLRTALGLADAGNDALWSHFTYFGISLPFNLIVAGTVNMDETTHGFSRKVLDRALSFDFGEFFPNNFDTFFEPDTQNLTLSYPIWSDGRNTDALATTFDSDGRKSVAFLKSVNTALDNTPFKLAFRALNELLLAVICTQPKTEQELMAVWDDFVMCKVLPRIEGDYDKLAVNAGAGSNNGGEQRTVLSELKKVLAEHMALIWVGEQRPDLYREKTEPVNGSKTISIPCRCNKKLDKMEQSLTSAGFTSFWP